MYLRFITQFKNGDEEIETGVFQAAAHLLKNEFMYSYDRDQLQEIWTWFSMNLKAPTRFNRSWRRGRPHISLSWFKHTAVVHLQKMFEMIVLLEKYDVIVTRVKRHRCGYIVYEDEHQVSSIPFRMDRKVVL